MITNEYTTVVANLLSGNSQYLPNYLYLEFKNTESVVAEPDLSSVSGKVYYDTLSGDASYLRIPITLKPTVDGDSITYTTLVSSTESINPEVVFSAENHSRIYAVALVVAPTPIDHTQDIVIAQSYLSGNSQLVAVDNQTFCFSFKLKLSTNE